MRIEIQESIRNINPIEQPRTSWKATSPAYIQPPSLPVHSVQPWDIPSRTPRPPSPPTGAVARDAPTAHHSSSGKSTLEWDMIKAGMTARAKQKEDYEEQGHAIDSNAIVMPGLRMGLPIEDA